jgi:Predicted AAA-ATPase
LFCEDTKQGDSRLFCVRTKQGDSHLFCVRTKQGDSRLFCEDTKQGDSHLFCVRTKQGDSHLFCVRTKQGVFSLVRCLRRTTNKVLRSTTFAKQASFDSAHSENLCQSTAHDTHFDKIPDKSAKTRQAMRNGNFLMPFVIFFVNFFYFCQLKSKIMQATRFPYGIGDYARLTRDNYIFVDKTPFIEKLENQGSAYIFLLRPRRFGKSLFISLLGYYYDINQKDNFEKLFGNRYIGSHKTQGANSYAILNFEFSRIDTKDFQSTYKGFLNNVKAGIEGFMAKYPVFSEKEKENIFSKEEPAVMLFTFFVTYKGKKESHKIYLLIDEYDHFANEILAFNTHIFSDMMSKNGFVRKFYESIKTAAMEGVVDRMFATGVTPLTLDSMTSGFNISTDLSRHEFFNEAMGFNFEEVQELVALACRDQDCNLPRIYKDMKNWYNGYIFHKNGSNRIYNSDVPIERRKKKFGFARKFIEQKRSLCRTDQSFQLRSRIYGA